MRIVSLNDLRRNRICIDLPVNRCEKLIERMPNQIQILLRILLPEFQRTFPIDILVHDAFRRDLKRTLRLVQSVWSSHLRIHLLSFQQCHSHPPIILKYQIHKRPRNVQVLPAHREACGTKDRLVARKESHQRYARS